MTIVKPQDMIDVVFPLLGQTPPCSKTSIAPGDGHYSWVQDVHTSVMM